MNVRFTLIADGPFDAVLIPVVTKMLRGDPRVVEIEGQFANPACLPKTRKGLMARVAAAISLFPADIFFVHRDAEREEYHVRRSEIVDVTSKLAELGTFVPIVPVRMTEAWLLFDEAAIRRAAGNPSGTVELGLPRLHDLEDIPNPKAALHSALLTASERHGRALRKFNSASAAKRVVELVDDFSPLSALAAYRALEAEIAPALEKLALNS